jgi:hypothetical protein
MRASAAGQSFSASSTKSEIVARIDADFGPFLKRVMGRLGATDTACAEAIGVARQTFAKHLDAGKSPRVSWLYMLPEIVRVAIAQDIVGDEYVVVKRSDVSASASDDFTRFGAIHAKTSALTATFAEHLSDGKVDIVEEQALIAKYDEMIAEAQSHVHAMRARQKGLRVVGS